jgi:hypothetical protein
MTGFDPAVYLATKQRRLRAWHAMLALIIVCALTALLLGAYELHAGGLTQFLFRAPGVGASSGGN